MQTPPTMTITLTPDRTSGAYRATVTCWGVTDSGTYGSVWQRPVPLPEAPIGSVPLEILVQLAVALLGRQ